MLSIVVFVISGALVVISSTQMAKYGDVIAVKTGLGRLFIGTVLLAAATSLPEILTNVAAVRENLPDLAAGNLLGSCIFNMFIIALLDIFNQQARVLRKVAVTHALTAALGITMLALTALFILARLNAGILGIGIDSIILVSVFLAGLYAVRRQGRLSGASVDITDEETPISLARAVLFFALACAVLWLSAPFLVRSSNELAEMTGVGTAFFGASALAIVTSLPEVTSSLAAVRLGAYDMAIGNLFGSNVFNMMTLALVDGFYTRGYFLSDISSNFALASLVALLLTAMALIGNLARVERRLFFAEIDALAIIVGYILGMYLLFIRGISLG